MSWWGGLSAEAQAAWVQAIGSVAAIFSAVGVAWFQARLSRKQQRMQWMEEQRHRRVAARPHVTIEEFTQLEDPPLQIFIQNNGVGTAIIVEFGVYVDGLPLVAERTRFWQALAWKLGLPRGVNSGGTVLADGQALPPGAKRLLMRYSPADPRVIEDGTIVKALERIGYEVKYKSIYGDPFEFSAGSTDRRAYFCLANPGEV